MQYCPMPTPAPTPEPPTPMPTPTPAPTPDPCPVDPNCAMNFGIKGTRRWCDCCGYDCVGSRDACVANDGFCSDVCTDHATCPTTTTVPPTTTTVPPTTTSTTTTVPPTTTTTTTAAPSTTTATATVAPTTVSGTVGPTTSSVSGSTTSGVSTTSASAVPTTSTSSVPPTTTTTVPPTTTTTVPPTTSTSSSTTAPVTTTTTTAAATTTSTAPPASTTTTTAPQTTSTAPQTTSSDTTSVLTSTTGSEPAASGTTSADGTTHAFQTVYPFLLPWERWGTVDEERLDPEMSAIYGHIMFAGAGLCLILCCLALCCCIVKKKKKNGGGGGDGDYTTKPGQKSGNALSNTSSKDSHLLRKGALGIPLLVEDLVGYLETRGMDTNGLFRESGKAELVEDILDGYEAGKPKDLSRVDDVHAVAVALKTYYKKRLPQPFLDVEFAGEYLRHKDVRPAAARVRAQRGVIDRMPKSKVDELRHLLNFLHNVAQHKAKNKMDARNLAIVFGPALFQSAFIVEATDVVVLLIQDYEALFEGAKPGDSGSEDEYTSSGSGSIVRTLGHVRALYDYEPVGNNPGEMRLDEGDVISLIEDVDENGWAQGSVKGRVGWFPMSYCERIDGVGVSDDSSSSYSYSSSGSGSSYSTSSSGSGSSYSSYSESSTGGATTTTGEASSSEESSTGASSTGTSTYSSSTGASSYDSSSGSGVTTTETESSYSESSTPPPKKSHKKRK
eukprot:CAMPEP_0168603034 /NCGR_PEP_ID=MMETSP0420-20121227/14486_1 /TAXON_ID=498008 /ORGANISM="Pessonella sp." /LENGTH=725 /DNA_ID=CAMNT_0008641933 /DNA_START=402 /DNA_END=2579 /DNA_ORIENTATION=+